VGRTRTGVRPFVCTLEHRASGEQTAKRLCYLEVVGVRRCRVSVTDLNGTTHSVSVHAETLFEAAAAAVGAFRQEPWAAEALTPNAVLRVEVQPPPIVHDVALKAVDRWVNGPTVSPSQRSAKRRVGNQ
jgi:hypothetical protein